MNWKNIESNLCPKCNSTLKKENDFLRVCSNSGCDFKIGEVKMKKIKDKFTNVHLKEVD